MGLAARRWPLRVPAHDLGPPRAEGCPRARIGLLSVSLRPRRSYTASKPSRSVKCTQARPDGTVRAKGRGEDAVAGGNADGLMPQAQGLGGDSSPPPWMPTRIGTTGFLPADEGLCASAAPAFCLRGWLKRRDARRRAFTERYHMKQSATPSGKPPARRRAARLFALALTLLALALALPAGAAASPGAAAAPTITSFTPHTGPVGTVVLLMGSGFTGARRVTLGRAEAAFTVHSDESIVLTVPAGALSGPISVTTPGGSAVSAGSFRVTSAKLVITVTAPTGTGSYAQGSVLTVSWETEDAVADGEFRLSLSRQGIIVSNTLVPATGAASYTTGVKLDVPTGSGYGVLIGWRPVVGSGRWSSFATSPGSFTVPAADVKAITAFSFQGLTPPVTGVINEAVHTIALTVPRGTDLHALVATFTVAGASVAVGGTPQVSGTTANDFSSPVTYRVTAFDGSTQDYVVTVPVQVLAIGDAYGGGVIAYILQSGDPGYSATVEHGLIAATGDQDGGTGIVWALAGYAGGLVPGGTSRGIGTGARNTTNIIAQNGAGVTYAAGLARAYTGGGYGDWYLPSQDELNKLYINRLAIGGFAVGEGVRYWSSSESQRGHALAQSFESGDLWSGLKDSSYRVRAVRSF